MRLYVILWYVAFSLLLNAAFLLISSLVSLLYGDSAGFPLLYSCLIAALFGIFPLIFIPARPDVTPQEGLGVVVYSWIASCLVGVLPYVLWGGEFTFTNAWFESVSGYTTTGSTILEHIEAVPRGLLFWRSATHFIGGIGIIILVLAVVPALSASGTTLFRAESSSLAFHDFRSSVRHAVHILLRVFIGLVAAETVLLVLFGMSVFDAVTTAFGTVATGGFSPRQASIATYQSVPIEVTVMLFMVLSGMHFGLLFAAVRGNFKAALQSSTTRYYVEALAIGTLIVMLSIRGHNYPSTLEALRIASFQVLSIGTSTGFATANSAIWPSLAQLVLVFFTFQCACAGSTSGGIKADRILVFLKTVVRMVRQVQHPKGIFLTMVGKTRFEDSLVLATVTYVLLYIGIVVVATAILCALGMDGFSALSGSAATMGNVGPGFGTVGSTASFAGVPEAGKWVLTATMLLGRLEVYGLVVCLLPGMFLLKE
jgi:trk system potassium uptake protein TrkH